MDLQTSNDQDDDDLFLDAVDDFPFYDCPDSFPDQSEPSTTLSAISTADPVAPPEISFPAVTIRCRLSASLGKSQKGLNDSSLDSSTISDFDAIAGNRESFRDKRNRICRDLKENGEKSESTQGLVSSVPVTNRVSEESNERSTITTASGNPAEDSVDSTAELDGYLVNLLVFLAGLVIKAIGFQVNLFITFITFPTWVIYNVYMFVMDPFQMIKCGKEYFLGKSLKLWDLVCGFISPLVFDCLKDHKSFLKVALRCGWGLLWSFYVCFILCGLLVLALVISGILMKNLVEEPIQMKQLLNFDFTKLRPVACVPIISCANAGCDMDCEEQIEARRRMGFRAIPPSHKLQATVSLVLPESEYNRNLGIFQVRLDYLAVKGETLYSSSHPCMLQFKSELIRLLSTLLKIAPLVAGYVSESQTLNVKFKGFTEGEIPTGCLRVTIEQRAEYRPGAGIPELYDASILLESELPLFKRILWYWKKTIFIWITMMSFMMELLCTLVCCRPIIMPRPRLRPRDGAIRSGATQNSVPAS